MPRYSSRSVRRVVTLAAFALALLAVHAGCHTPSGDATTSAPSDTADASTAPDTSNVGDTLTVVVFGNSLAAGYGLSKDEAFPALLEAKADSAGLARVEVVNAGSNGETTDDGRRRIGRVLQRDDLDVLVLELGANDALRGLSADAARANLRAIMDETKARFPDARLVLAGLQAPPTMNTGYAKRFEAIYPALAEETRAALVPFLLEGVAGRPALNQADGLHPNVQGQQRLAANVRSTLGPLLHQMRGASQAVPTS